MRNFTALLAATALAVSPAVVHAAPGQPSQVQVSAPLPEDESLADASSLRGGRADSALVLGGLVLVGIVAVMLSILLEEDDDDALNKPPVPVSP